MFNLNEEVDSFKKEFDLGDNYEYVDPDNNGLGYWVNEDCGVCSILTHNWIGWIYSKKSTLVNNHILPKEPTEDMLKYLSGNKVNAEFIYKGLMELSEKGI